MRFIVLYVLGILLVVTSCSITNKFEKAGINTISFGSGGGFTGLYKTYELDIESKNVHLDSSRVKTLNTSQLKSLYAYISNGVHKEKINKPGNITYFMKFHGKEISNTLNWGDRNYTPPKDVLALYEHLNSLIREKD